VLDTTSDASWPDNSVVTSVLSTNSHMVLLGGPAGTNALMMTSTLMTQYLL
jgi:hypothetical protein